MQENQAYCREEFLMRIPIFCVSLLPCEQMGMHEKEHMKPKVMTAKCEEKTETAEIAMSQISYRIALRLRTPALYTARKRKSKKIYSLFYRRPSRPREIFSIYFSLVVRQDVHMCVRVRVRALFGSFFFFLHLHFDSFRHEIPSALGSICSCCYAGTA